MIFEHYSQPVLPFGQWLLRVARSFGLAGLFVLAALGIGIAGYHFLGGLGLVDSIMEASMILGGMGPVASMSGNAVKLFAAAYALFSGLMGVSIFAILIAPWLHRMLHHANTGK